MDVQDIPQDVDRILFTRAQIDEKVAELAALIDEDYKGKQLLLVGVLKGAIMIVADLMRAMHNSEVAVDWMAVSSYGAGTKSTGVVRILKDLDIDIKDKHVLIVEDIIDSGLTLDWLRRNLESREPASLEICTFLRKPEAVKTTVDVKYVGFDISNEFVIGYGFDQEEKYRNLNCIGTLAPHLY